MVDFNGTRYGYVHNLQGDVIALVDSSGTQVVEYTYDAWGWALTKTSSMAATLGTLNPFRYRGYVYDEETGLYYLRSRYYFPEFGRFINADSVLGKTGHLITHNIFAYCSNNPINLIDPSGNIPNHALMLSDGGSNKPYYPYYGLPKEVAQAIDIILEDPAKYSYSKRNKETGKYDYGIYVKNGEICVCCQSLLRGLLGGEARGVRTLVNNLTSSKQIYTLTSLNQLKPGDWIISGTNHVGLVLLYDFGQGYELAVFQSTSVNNFSTISAAKFMNDANAGPNITALRTLGNWDSYSDVTFDAGAFFFDSNNKGCLFGN